MAPVVTLAPSTTAKPLELPRSASSVPGPVLIALTPRKIVPSNLRAASLLYAARHQEEMGLFQAADTVAAAIISGTTKPKTKGSGASTAEARARAYVAGRGERLTPTERASFIQLVGDGVQMDFEVVASDSAKQMEAYARLVASVSASLDEFADDNVSSERDHLVDEADKSADDLALTMSNHAYGGAHYAASKLAEHARIAFELLKDPEILDAYGVSSMHELIAKITKKTTGEIQLLERRGEAGARLIASLADNVDLLGAPAKRVELARRLAPLGAHAKEWLSVKPARGANGASLKLRALCFDAARKVVPCTVAKP